MSVATVMVGMSQPFMALRRVLTLSMTRDAITDFPAPGVP